MTKSEFESALRERLSRLPEEDASERIGFYIEMIEDGMEDGLDEEAAVAAVGGVDAVADQIIGEVPLARLARERMKPKRRLSGWEIALIAIGSPIWFSLAVAAFAILISLCASLLALIVSAWAVFGALAGGGVGGVLVGIGLMIGGEGGVGIVTVGAGMVCAGLAIFAFFGCLAAMKALARLCRSSVMKIKRLIVGKERA